MAVSPISGISFGETKPVEAIQGFNKNNKHNNPSLKSIFEAAGKVINPEKTPNQVVPAFSANAGSVFKEFNNAGAKGKNFTATA